MKNMTQQQEDIKAFGDITRETLDMSDSVVYSEMAKMGIDEDLLRQISSSNHEPEWMLDLRLRSLEIFRGMQKPTW